MAVKHLKSTTKAFFEKAFPARQIQHRSGGSVRYIYISSWRQAMMAGAATLLVGWCMFATVAVLLGDVRRRLGPNEIAIPAFETKELQDQVSLLRSELVESRSKVVELETRLAAAPVNPQYLEQEIASVRAYLKRSQFYATSLEKELAELKRKQAAEAPAVLNPRWWYDVFKKSVNGLEPENDYTPRESLDRFLWLVQAAIYAVFGGFAAGFGLFFGRMLIRVKVDAKTGAP